MDEKLREIDREIKKLFKERKQLIKAKKKAKSLHPDLFRKCKMKNAKCRMIKAPSEPKAETTI